MPHVSLAGIFRCSWALLLAGMILFAAPAPAQDFKPGQVIEYKVRGAYPEAWERGVIIRPLDGGKQYLIHEKPSQFFPEGPEIAFSPANLRAPQAPSPARQVGAEEPSAPRIDSKAPLRLTAASEAGLLSKADVIAYARRLFGPGDPFADGKRRDMLLDQIRDYIKSRGTNFLPDLKFSNELGALGAYSVHIGSACEANYGKAPRLEDYFGTYLLRTTNRGTKSNSQQGAKIVITTTDAQYESGALEIKKDGAYLWKLGRNDPESLWVRGRWREAKADELHLWEGGPAIWLEKARQNEDYLVRKCRVPDYEGWIDLGMTKGRIAAHYGRPK